VPAGSILEAEQPIHRSKTGKLRRFGKSKQRPVRNWFLPLKPKKLREHDDMGRIKRFIVPCHCPLCLRPVCSLGNHDQYLEGVQLKEGTRRITHLTGPPVYEGKEGVPSKHRHDITK